MEAISGPICRNAWCFQTLSCLRLIWWSNRLFQAGRIKTGSTLPHSHFPWAVQDLWTSDFCTASFARESTVPVWAFASCRLREAHRPFPCKILWHGEVWYRSACLCLWKWAGSWLPPRLDPRTRSWVSPHAQADSRSQTKAWIFGLSNQWCWSRELAHLYPLNTPLDYSVWLPRQELFSCPHQYWSNWCRWIDRFIGSKRWWRSSSCRNSSTLRSLVKYALPIARYLACPSYAQGSG